MPNYSYVQTFYVNPETVENSPTVMLKTIELFFKTKPAGVSVSGAIQPGVSISLCKTNGSEPIVDSGGILSKSIVRLPYNNINVSDNATVGTVFKFRDPVLVESGKTYGVLIEMEDAAYDVWINTKGESLIAAGGLTNTPSAGTTSNFRGMLYKSSPSVAPGSSQNAGGITSTEYTPYADKDLKFNVKISKFIIPSNKSISIDVVNKNYEFLTISSRNGTFTGGEYVYQNDSNKPGTITVSSSNFNVVGSGTSFTSHTIGQYVVFTVNNVTNVIKIADIINDTLMTLEYLPSVSGSTNYKVPPVARVYYANYVSNEMILVDSTAANSTFKFDTGSVIVGGRSTATTLISSINKQSVDSFIPRFNLGNPAFADVKTNYRFSYATKDGSFWTSPTAYPMDINKDNEVTAYDAYIHSKSLEVSDTGYSASGKSAVANITFTYDTSKNYTFQAPFVDGTQLDLYSYKYDVANTTAQYTTITDASGNTYKFDTETTKDGISRSRYISKKISFAPNRAAEDLVVYATMYRPKNSDVKIYAKIHNALDNESFEDKTWTPLEIKTNADRYSQTQDDLIEYQYGLPSTPATTQVLSGNFTTQLANAQVATTVDHSSTGTNLIAANSAILLYDDLLPTNRDVYVVAAANSTIITLSRAITNNNLVSASGGNVYGYIKLAPLVYKNAAFNNILNDNVARYISSSLVKFNNFNSMQIKIVLNSDVSYDVPFVDTIQAIGVSS